MRNLIVVDIDDTLADISHRKILYGVDWIKYNRLAKLDDVILPNLLVLNLLLDRDLIGMKKNVILLTGRYKSQRYLTQKWLHEHNIPYGKLIMKPIEDDRSSFHFKTEWVEKHKNSILVVMDDRKDIRKFCENLGLITISPYKI